MRDQSKLKANVKLWRKKTKQLLVEYKGGCCEFCGYNKCIEALEFHHIDETTKEFSVSGSTKSLEKQKKEADKCYMLCANCHRELHAGFEIYHRPSVGWVSEWSKELDCKSNGYAYVGSNPTLPTLSKPE